MGSFSVIFSVMLQQHQDNILLICDSCWFFAHFIWREMIQICLKIYCFLTSCAEFLYKEMETQCTRTNKILSSMRVPNSRIEWEIDNIWKKFDKVQSHVEGLLNIRVGILMIVFDSRSHSSLKQQKIHHIPQQIHPIQQNEWSRADTSHSSFNNR